MALHLMVQGPQGEKGPLTSVNASSHVCLGGSRVGDPTGGVGPLGFPAEENTFG
jgi:hypothetical protein